MTRVRSILLAAVVLVGVVTLTGVGASSEEPQIVVTDITLTPENPAPGQTVTLRATITNSESSATRLTDVDVALRSASDEGTFQYARIGDVSTLPPGSSIEVPLTVTFEDSGIKQLYIQIWGTADPTVVTYRYPVTVRVAERNPKISVDINDTVAGREGEGRIVVSNGLESTLSNVELSVRDRAGAVEFGDRRFVIAELGSGETATFPFTYESDTAGTHEGTAMIEYIDAAGDVARTNEAFTVEIEPRRGNVTMVAKPTSEDGTDVTVDIINTRNLPIKHILLDGTSSNATVSQQFIAEIPAQSSRSVVLNTSLDGRQAAIQLSATYEVGDSEGTVSDALAIRSVPGQIDLTGVEIQQEDERLLVTGSASNVGLEEVNSVVVRVKNTTRVTPAPPAREYFVGTVPSSDFVSFEVFARTNGTVSAIPLEVTYLVGEQRYNRTVKIPYEEVGSHQTPAPSANERSLLALGMGSVLVGIVAVIIYVGWRNSRERT